ncbi:MAG: DUF2510 domain-containing protein [Ilumatobacteraceae bacterium]
MRVEDAPPAGWYPDPEGYSRLRWWEGTDWADRYRAPPTPSETDLPQQSYARQSSAPGGASEHDWHQGGLPSVPMAQSEEILNQARHAARAEAARASQLFEQQARAMAKNITPLISQYTNKLIRWVRLFSVIAVALLLGWVAFQVFAQVSLFEWIGDRIDNLSNDSGMLIPLR